MLYAIKTVEEHIEPIAANMRLDDVREIWAAGKRTPVSALKMSMALGKHNTIMLSDKPVGMFGVTPLSVIGRHGSPWLLGTDELANHSRSFLKGCIKHFPEVTKGFDFLENYVDARNSVSIMWLKWLGFVIMEPEPYGPFKLPFHRFYMEK